MTPAVPLIDPLPLPAPAWLLSALLALTFTLHLVPMNLLLGGSILALVARFRGRHDAHAAALSRLIARAMPVVFAAAVTLGVAALLFLQVLYGRVFFAGAVLLGVPWILIVPLVIVAYYFAYLESARASGPAAGDQGPANDAVGAGLEARGQVVAVGAPAARVRRAGATGAALAGGFVMTIAFIQANVMSLLLRPQAFTAMFHADASGVRLNLGDATLAPRFLHVLFGALAVSGLAVSVAGFLLRRGEPRLGPWMIRHGAYVCAGATVVNIIPGFWWLAALPSGMLLQFMGRNLGATLWLAGGVVAALAALGHIIPAAMAREPRSLIAGAAGSMLLTIVCMVAVRDIVRRALLGPEVLPPAAWVQPQWGAIALFLALLAAALGLVWWMVVSLAAPSSARATPPRP
jgi:hypothetical protein